MVMLKRVRISSDSSLRHRLDGASLSEIIDIFIQTRARIRHLKQIEKEIKEFFTDTGHNTFDGENHKIIREVSNITEWDDNRLHAYLKSRAKFYRIKDRKRVDYLIIRKQPKST
jgi:hypothetical protein